MHPLKNLTLSLTVALAFAVGGCSQLGRDIDEAFQRKGAETTSAAMDTAMMQPVPAQPVASYNTLAQNYSNDSVQLFPLDDAPQHLTPAPMAAGAGAGMAYDMNGMQSSTDPSVTVFPFSDGATGPYVPGVMPVYANGGGGLDNLPNFTGSPARIYFEHGSAALSATARKVLASVAQRYQQQTPGYMVAVDGHASARTGIADPVKSRMLNFDMSMKRAMAVTKQLIHDGVPVDSVKATAYGDTHPAVAEETKADEARNRRVEITAAPR